VENPQQFKRGNRRTQIGIVVSDKMNKTVTVSIERSFPHPFYKKIIKRNSKILAHDENEECNIGDQIRIMETRPLSKRKRWRVCEIIQKAQ
jgi:small subunit ribosomal protein S17